VCDSVDASSQPTDDRQSGSRQASTAWVRIMR
jgi:hypothetical protein